MKDKKLSAHSTEREVKFLKGIIDNKNMPNRRTPWQIKSTIEKYINTIHTRRWDEGCDAVIIESYARVLLAGVLV